MGVYVIGVVGVIVFYLAVLGVGIWAATVKTKKARPGQDAMMLANRGLGPLLGIFTLIGEPRDQRILFVPPATYHSRCWKLGVHPLVLLF